MYTCVYIYIYIFVHTHTLTITETQATQFDFTTDGTRIDNDEAMMTRKWRQNKKI